MQKIAVVHLGHSHLAAATPFLYDRPIPPLEGNFIEHYVFNTGKFNIFAVDETRFSFGATINGKLQMNPVIKKFIEGRIPPDREIVIMSMIGGNSHNAMMMLQPGRQFDFVVPTRPDLPFHPDVEVVPYDAIIDVISNNSSLYLQEMAGVAASFNGRMFHVISPPPIEDDARVSEVVECDPYFKQLSSRVVTPSLIRYKSWLAHTAIFSDHCKLNGISTIAPPAAGTIDGSWLALDCIGADPTHGNLTYSGHLFREIERTLGGSFSGWDWLG